MSSYRACGGLDLDLDIGWSLPVNKSQSKTNIQKRRRLSELYVKGAEVRFNESGGAAFDPKVTDDEGNPKQVAGDDDFVRTDDDIILWVQPPSPLQREQALREAQAARSRALLAAKKDADSVDAANTQAFVQSMTDDVLRRYLLDADEQERRERAQRDVLAEEEWDDFSALQDAMRQWDEAGNPRTEEWQTLIDRDADFGKQINKQARYLREVDEESMALVPRQELEKRAFEKRIDLVGSQAFVQRYEREMIFYAVRSEEDHDELFYEDVEAFGHEDDLIQILLSDTLATFIEDPAEAKNSPRAASGSEPSELPAEPETSEASTPETQSD